MWKLILLAPLAGLFGCGHDCNLMYAPDQLSIAFDPEITAQGSWRFELSVDVYAECEVELPVPDPSNMDYTPCGGAGGVDLRFSEDGLAVTDLVIGDEAPATVTLTVLFDGSLVYEETLTPAYDVDEPNGAGCGERYSTEVTVEVPEP